MRFLLDPVLIPHRMLSIGPWLGPPRLCDLLNVLNLINDRRKAGFQNPQTDRRTDGRTDTSPILQSVVSPGPCCTSTLPQKRIDSELFDVSLSAPTAFVFSLLVGCQNPTTVGKLNFSLRQQVTFDSSVSYSE